MSPANIDARARLSVFAGAGLLDLDPETANLGIQAINTVRRTLGFLDLTLVEYETAAEEFEVARKLHNEAARTHDVIVEAHVNIETFVEVVHLKIETFYLFARILLDDVVRVLDVLIGIRAGRPIGSHSKLARRLPELVAARGVDGPPGDLDELIEKVQGISDFRDYYVAHLRLAGAVKATVSDSFGGPAISVRTIVARSGASSPVTSEPIRELRDLLEDYVMAWIDYFVATLPASRVAGVTI